MNIIPRIPAIIRLLRVTKTKAAFYTGGTPVDKLTTALDIDIGFTGREINNIQNLFQLDTSQDTNILRGRSLQIIQMPS